MSIETLKQDLSQVMKAIPDGPLVSSSDLAQFLRHNLLPLVESLVDETTEIDAVVGTLVENTEDVLHEDSAAVFAAMIACGKVLVDELSTRIGNDQRLIKLIKEYREQAVIAGEILDDIVIPDPEGDEDEEGAEGESDPAVAAPGGAQ